MNQHRRHFDSGRRTKRLKRAYALCARDLYWQPDTSEFQRRMTADPLLVTCRACHAKPEYRAVLLILEPQVMAVRFRLQPPRLGQEHCTALVRSAT